jgi:hypothetical protein
MFFVPAFVIGFATILRHASGPFWIGKNFDPEYAYLMNSLLLTQGLSVGHADHPGSTLQWAGAIWLYGINLLLGKDDLITDVLTRPEFYLAYMHMALLSILFLTLVMAAWLTFRWTGDIVAALLMQVGILMSYTARHALARMSPEPLLLILGLWLAITVLYHHYLIRQCDDNNPYWQYGLIAGLGMGLKITFLPLWFLPLILLKGFRHVLLYLAISGIVFITLTANPLMHFTGFRKFTFGHLIAREGYNRPIELGVNKFQSMIDGFFLLLGNSWQFEKPLLLLVLIFVANGLLILFVKSYRGANNGNSWNIRLSVGLFLTLIGQIVLVANGPDARLHYLCPVLGLTGLLAAIPLRWPAMELKPKLKSLSWGRTTYLVVILLIIGSTVLRLPRELGLAAAGAKNWQEAHRFKTDNRLLNEATVYYYRSSSQRYALSFGNSLAQRHFSKQLSSLYPNFFDFHKWSGRLYSHFGEKKVTLDEIVNGAEKVLIQGQNWSPPIIPSLEATGYYSVAPFPLSKPSHHIIPTKSPQAFSAEVIFRGTHEWIVLLRAQPHNTATEDINLK